MVPASSPSCGRQACGTSQPTCARPDRHSPCPACQCTPVQAATHSCAHLSTQQPVCRRTTTPSAAPRPMGQPPSGTTTPPRTPPWCAVHTAVEQGLGPRLSIVHPARDGLACQHWPESLCAGSPAPLLRSDSTARRRLCWAAWPAAHLRRERAGGQRVTRLAPVLQVTRIKDAGALLLATGGMSEWAFMQISSIVRPCLQQAPGQALPGRTGFEGFSRPSGLPGP